MDASTMSKYILTIAVLAICAMAQDQAPPAPAPPPPRDSPVRRPQDREQTDHSPEEEQTDSLDLPADCPPATGREWICKTESWDPVEKKVVSSMDIQKCDKDDSCYLGPIVSRPLIGLWERKWMCGPKPCRMTGFQNGVRLTNACPGPEDTCDVGPYDIMVNGSRYSATFCNHKPVPQNKTEPTWAPQLCSVNSSASGYVNLKPCEGGEMCARGPINFWHKGGQHRAYICTKTPGLWQIPSQRSQPQEMMHAIHVALGEIGDALVLDGHVIHEGPHMMIDAIDKKLSDLKKHVDFAEQQAKEMGHMGPIKIPDYAMDILEMMQLNVYLLEMKVNSLMGRGAAERVLGPLRMAVNWLFGATNGGQWPIPAEKWLFWTEETLKMMIYLIEKNNLKNPMAKVFFVNTHETMMGLKEALMEKEGNERAMEAYKKVAMDMLQLWNLMSGGPTQPGATAASIGKDLDVHFKMLIMAVKVLKKPEERIEDAENLLEELSKLAREGKISSDRAREVFHKIYDKLFVQTIPANQMGMEIIELVKYKIQETWNHISNGPIPPASRPEVAIQQVLEALRELKNNLQPSSPRNGSGDGSQGSRGRDAALKEILQILSGLDRKLQGGEREMDDDEHAPDRQYEEESAVLDQILQMLMDMKNGESGPPPQQEQRPPPQKDSSDIREQLNKLQRTVTEMMQMTDNREENMGKEGYGNGDDKMGGDMMQMMGNMGEDMYMDNFLKQMMGNMGGSMTIDEHGDDMGKDEDDKKKSCPEQLWKRQIPLEEARKWSPAPDAFFGPEPSMPPQSQDRRPPPGNKK